MLSRLAHAFSNSSLYSSCSPQVHAACQDVYNTGLVMGTDGNVSTRVPGTEFMAIKASGVDYPSMTLRDVVLCKLDGTPLPGEKKVSGACIAKRRLEQSCTSNSILRSWENDSPPQRSISTSACTPPDPTSCPSSTPIPPTPLPSAAPVPTCPISTIRWER